jgi:hypothetical protein
MTEKIIFLVKEAIYLPLSLHEGCLSYRKSPQKITHSKTLSFFTFFLFLWIFLLSWIRIQPNKINANPCGSGSTTQLYCTSNAVVTLVNQF